MTDKERYIQGEEFSREFMPWCRTGREPDLSVLRKTIELIEKTSPKFWIIEKVKGAVRWFRPVLGAPTRVINPIYLWGAFPPLSIRRVVPWKERLSSSRTELRAAIPYSLSLNLALAVESAIEWPA